MKQAGFILLMVVLLSCSGNKETPVISTDLVSNPETASGPVDKSKLPVIKFTEDKHDFGKIVQGEMVNHVFTFTNEGKSNLIVSSAKASCGCTVAEPPKEPIAPGASGKISVTFDSNGRDGSFTKTISVVSNCQPNTYLLTIHGEIIVPGKSGGKEEKSN